MKIIITKHENYSEVVVRDASGVNIHAYVFDDHEQAKAFIQGFKCARSVANSLIQSMPMDYSLVKTTPETIGEQLSHQWVGRA